MVVAAAVVAVVVEVVLLVVGARLVTPVFSWSECVISRILSCFYVGHSDRFRDSWRP